MTITTPDYKITITTSRMACSVRVNGLLAGRLVKVRRGYQWADPMRPWSGEGKVYSSRESAAREMAANFYSTRPGLPSGPAKRRK